MKKTILLLGLFLSSAVCQAAGWTPPLTVERAFTEDSDLVVIYTSEGTVYSPGCQANAWIFRASTDARRARGWATILTALTTGQKVMFWYTDVCPTWNYHDAMSVMLAKP